MNSFIKTLVPLMATIVILNLSSCNTVPVETVSAELPNEVPVESDSFTKSDFIFPKVALNASGELLPYQASTNPYDLLPAPAVSPELSAQFKQALKAQEKGDFSSARSLLSEITKVQPELSGPWFQLGNIAAKEKNWDAAVSAYQAAVNANDWNTWAWLALGLSYRQIGDMETAKTNYTEALKRWPDFAEAHKNMAILLDIYSNLPEQAQPHFEAYQILTSFKDEEANDWVTEISRRTGAERLMPIWQESMATTQAFSEGPAEGNGK